MTAFADTIPNPVPPPQEQTANWRSIGDLAAELLRKAQERKG
jgi:hypothetical protein